MIVGCPQVRLGNMKVVVVHIGPRGLTLQMVYTVIAVRDLPHQAGSLGHENEKQPVVVGILRQILLGPLMLALTGGTMDERDALFLGPGMDSAAEPPDHSCGNGANRRRRLARGWHNLRWGRMVRDVRSGKRRDAYAPLRCLDYS